MTGSSTWMPPALLLTLFISAHLSSFVRPCKVHEFNSHVEQLKKNVKNCSGNCTLTDTDTRCRCLNLTVSHGECGFPDYFIQGLDILPQNIHDNALRKLKPILKGMNQSCYEKICSLGLTYEPVTSPEGFRMKLQQLGEQLGSVLAQTRGR